MTVTQGRARTSPARGQALRRVLYGPDTRPRAARPALSALLAATALLYLGDLSVSAWGNEYYAAAAQAGSRSWSALLFGSHDAGNSITVDKPPASLWLMGLSARVFGFGSWSVLLPQALLGIGSVALLYAAVRRWCGVRAGLLAGAALAATPVAALMFRYDNPDALLTFLLIAAAYCTVRAIDAENSRWWSAGTGWLALAAVAIGFGFLTKLLQALLVVPALGAVFLLAAPGGFWSRTGKLMTAGVTLVLAGGWYVALVEIWPAGARPYIGGSANNSLWELALGYNGLGRLLGGHGNPGGPSDRGPAGAQLGPAFGGDTGITRLFRDLMATEVSWLLPAALIGLVAGLWMTRRARRTDRLRAALILWGGWLLVTALVFSFMSGVIHPYYTVALAPAVAALVGVGVSRLWRSRERRAATLVLAVMAAVTGAWSFILLDRTPEWLPWLRWTIIAAAAFAAVAFAVLGCATAESNYDARRTRWLPTVAAVAALLAGFAGTTSYAVVTAMSAHGGGIPASGPRGDAAAAGPHGGPPTGGPPAPLAGLGMAAGSGEVDGGRAIDPFGGPDADDTSPAPQRMSRDSMPSSDMSSSGTAALPGTASTSEVGPPRGAPPGPGGPPGIAHNAELEAMLRASDRRWTAATVGSFGASALELRTGTSVMAIGGFAGGDDAPSLDRFRELVADGEIGYFVAARRPGPSPARPDADAPKSTGEQIAEWVQTHYTARQVGDVTVYDLT
ncbi:ArnT family glycosyltransferase [Nocardia arizonensis]|uniref:ArnT family glycosyltransferase n=1 Tax=Nocardia arizonensis TaxID=1141647 RepID=UPI0007A74B7F|nr:glycosyltransferase family 39 protein [Nocardia arizonensis]